MRLRPGGHALYMHHNGNRRHSRAVSNGVIRTTIEFAIVSLWLCCMMCRRGRPRDGGSTGSGAKRQRRIGRGHGTVMWTVFVMQTGKAAD